MESERTDDDWKAYFKTIMRGQPNPATDGLYNLMAYCLRHAGRLDAVVEIGTFAGQSASIITRFAGEVYCVDPYRAGYDPDDSPVVNSEFAGREKLVMEAMSEVMHGHRYRLLRMKSQDAAAEVPALVDMVYLDGDHRYECIVEDLALWTPKVRSGGCIAGHDFTTDPDHPHLHGVRRAAIEAFGREPDAIFEDSSWVYKR